MKGWSDDGYSDIFSTFTYLDTSSSFCVGIFEKGSPVIDRVSFGLRGGEGRGGEGRGVDTGYAKGRNSELTRFNMDKLLESKVLVLAVSIFEGVTESASSLEIVCLPFGIEVRNGGEVEVEAWSFSVMAISLTDEP